MYGSHPARLSASVLFQPFSFNSLAMARRFSLSNWRYFCFVFLVFALNILCRQTRNSSCNFFISSVLDSDSCPVGRLIPISVFAVTNFVSRFGSGIIPKFSSFVLFFWSTTNEMKKRSFEICVAMG